MILRLVIFVTVFAATVVATGDLIADTAPLSGTSDAFSLAKEKPLFNASKESAILKFAVGSRQLRLALADSPSVALVAVLPTASQFASEDFTRRVAFAAKFTEQLLKRDDVHFILTDSQAEKGLFAPNERFLRIINEHMRTKVSAKDVDPDVVRGEHADLRSAKGALLVDGRVPRSFMSQIAHLNFPAFVVARNGKPVEVWEGTMDPIDLACRVEAISSMPSSMGASQLVDFALHGTRNATVIVRHTSNVSHQLRLALSPFAQFAVGDASFFSLGRIPRGSFVVLTGPYVVSDLPIPRAAKRIDLTTGLFSTEAASRLRANGMMAFAIDSFEGGKDSHTFSKAIRRFTLSQSKSRSMSLSLPVGEAANESVLSATLPTAPVINSDLAIGMESLRIISSLVVPAVLDFRRAHVQAIYARAPCIVFAFHGEGLYEFAAEDLTPSLRRKCTFLYSNTGEQKLVASFGFSLHDAGNEKRLLIGVHYNHGKYAHSIDMDLVTAPTRNVVGQTDEVGEDTFDSPPCLDEPCDELRSVPFNVKAASKHLAPFVQSILSGEAQLYERTQQFEGEHSDPSSEAVGGYFKDFLDADDIHSHMLSDFLRDSFIVTFPPDCPHACEESLRLMSTVVSHFDTNRDSGISRHLAIAFYNLTANALHKHMHPSLVAAKEARLSFFDRSAKFKFFIHNHARYSNARFPGGMGLDGESEDGVIENLVMGLEGATPEDVFAFIKANCLYARHLVEADGSELEAIEYDEL